MSWEEACDVLAARYGMLPWEVWAAFPLRHIQRFYYHAVREKWRDRYFRLRLEDPKIQEPEWLYEDPDKKARGRSSKSDFERMKAAWRERRAAPSTTVVRSEVSL